MGVVGRGQMSPEKYDALAVHSMWCEEGRFPMRTGSCLWSGLKKHARNCGLELESPVTMFIVLFLNSGARNVSLAAISDDEDKNSILNGVREGSLVSEVFVGQNHHASPKLLP